MLTFAVGGFFTVIGAIACSVIVGTKFVIGEQVIVISAPEATLVIAFLSATLLAYVSRRNKKDDHDHEIKKLEMKKDEE